MQIQVRINEEGALRNQRFAFTNRLTLVSELLQNARRAGASLIEVRYDPTAQTLEVSDDGRGIDDFQKLLSFHESGWDRDQQAIEHPFGVGFSKCLFAAQRCEVESGHQRVDIDTERALDREPLDVVRMDVAVRGARIRLSGVDLPGFDRWCIENLCKGFPIPVHFNGEPLRRPHAEANLPMQTSSVGAVHLTGTRDGKHGMGVVLYLQGFEVYRTLGIESESDNVVHLDPTQFMARAPDRDTLIDESVQVRRVDAALTACWQRTLEIALTQIDPQQFVDTYHRVMDYCGLLHLMNPLPVLPRRICRDIVGYPVQLGPTADRFDAPVDEPITREAIEQRQVTLVSLDPVSEETASRWMFARLKGWRVLREMGVAADHWVLSWTRHLDNEPITVEPIGEVVRGLFCGHWVCPTVVICERVRLTLGEETVESIDEAVAHGDVVYVPRGEASGRAVQQLADYIDSDDQFMKNELEEDQEGLAVLIRRLRTPDPAAALTSLLRDVRPSLYPQLQGQCFEVSIPMSGEVDPVVKLLMGVGAEASHG
jgi:hypothetical protein